MMPRLQYDIITRKNMHDVTKRKGKETNQTPFAAIQLVGACIDAYIEPNRLTDETVVIFLLVLFFCFFIC